jgi:Phage protein Gp138 N-terminal domain
MTPLFSQLPTVRASLAHVLAHSTARQRLTMDNMMPAIVVNFNRATNNATVQPAISWVDVDNNATPRPQLIQIPVLSLGGGGFHISFPLNPGDLGWIHASDRDIELFLQNLQQTAPDTTRNHEFADGMFIPDVFYKYTINGADSAAMVIQSTDGTTRVSISEGKVNITAPGSVTVTTPQATFTGNVTIDGNATVVGMTEVNGGFNATAGGNQVCTLPQATTINGITVSSHGHQQQNNGSGRTADGMIT